LVQVLEVRRLPESEQVSAPVRLRYTRTSFGSGIAACVDTKDGQVVPRK